MRLLSVVVLTLLAGGLAVAAEETEELGSRLSRDRTILTIEKPRANRRQRPAAASDPVEPITEEHLAALARRPSPDLLRKITDSLIERTARHYYKAYSFPEPLVAFLEKNVQAREVFITALDHRYDDIAAAARIIEELRASDEKLLARYIHLATALAVVYDDPSAVVTSRYFRLWGVTESQFGPVADHKANWSYYTDPFRARSIPFALDKLPWCILVHLVDNDLPNGERLWAVQKHRAADVGERMYQSVPYDYVKLGRTGTTLGDRPYTLQNLLAHGGVCVEQGHFTSRVAKSLGVPAMKVRGEGRFGSAGHLWTGYLVFKNNRPVLDFCGRFFNDYYYTGDIFDPQTRTMTLDRFVAMMYDGASLSYPKYNQSQVLTRIAESLAESNPRESLSLTREALKLNYFNMWAWPLLMRHISAGTMDAREGLTWFNPALMSLKGHPDMTFECLDAFLSCLPREDVARRQSLFNQLTPLYKERPDLQLRLKIAQAKELIAASKAREALQILAGTINENAKESSLVLPAVELAVNLALEQGIGPQVRQALQQAENAFPKTRGRDPPPAYAEFVKLIEKLN